MSEDLIQRVTKVIAASKRIPVETVTIDSEFAQLGIDSMDAVEILFALEGEFDISIPDEEVRSVRNVRDMCAGVERLVAAKNADGAGRPVTMRRVAITGTGAISALGRNTTEFAESLLAGRGGIGQIESTGVTTLRFQNGAEVKNYCHQPYFEDRRADFMDRFAQFAVIAAREAVEGRARVDPGAARDIGDRHRTCVGGQPPRTAGSSSCTRGSTACIR